MSARPVSAISEDCQARPLTIADLEAVMAIEREIYPFPWTAENFHSALGSAYASWVVEVDNTLIGYAILMWLPDEVHLLNLAVAARWQGYGVGRRMLAWLADASATRGAGSMLLEVRPSNERARRLYESTGFSVIGLRKGYYPSFNGTREDAWVMRMPLDAHGVQARSVASGGTP